LIYYLLHDFWYSILVHHSYLHKPALNVLGNTIKQLSSVCLVEKWLSLIQKIMFLVEE
jgi:hypothetical protein